MGQFSVTIYRATGAVLSHNQQVGKAAQFAPAFLGALAELEHHVQHTVTAQAALGAFGSVPDRSKVAFDWV